VKKSLESKKAQIDDQLRKQINLQSVFTSMGTSLNAVFANTKDQIDKLSIEVNAHLQSDYTDMSQDKLNIYYADP